MTFDHVVINKAQRGYRRVHISNNANDNLLRLNKSVEPLAAVFYGTRELFFAGETSVCAWQVISS